MMTEAQAIEFYRGLFKLYPKLLELTEKDLMGRSGAIYKILTGVTPTRDHIKIALQQYTGNRIKRAWDIKQRYMILLFLRNIRITNNEVHSIILSLFNQRTRPGVIDSCKEEALHLVETLSKQELDHWQSKVEEDYQKKAKEPNILEL
jgi:hypothetical protein